jgi:coenzyme F420-reducing hydrogenase delta subunit
MSDEPVILAFCCHYCAYAAADMAGSMRLQYPSSVRALCFPCTGKIEVNHVLAAFERGVDGIFVAGCLEGGCHYLEGNLRARRRMERAKGLLDEIGLGAGRLEMFNLSSAEGPRFAEIAREMHERIVKLGPSPLRRGRAAVLDGVTDLAQQAEAQVHSAGPVSAPGT